MPFAEGPGPKTTQKRAGPGFKGSWRKQRLVRRGCRKPPDMQIPLLRSEWRRTVVRMLQMRWLVPVCFRRPAVHEESQRMFGETGVDDDWKKTVPQETPPRVSQEQRV